MLRFVRVAVLITFFCSFIVPPPQSYAQGAADLPKPGTMVNLSPAFEPVLIKGLKVHPENPFQFDFIIDTGNSGFKTNDARLKDESSKLIKYFLASLTVPEKDLWVNLSPYEKDRMIAPNLGQTEMGRDMLAQDYILKQLTASLIYPEKGLGKTFWDKVYAEAQSKFGTTNIPVNTFNKVWIVADKADVFERGNAAYVVGAHLKVMLEEDYLAVEKNRGLPGDTFRGTCPQAGCQANEALNVKATQQVIREVILPAIEHEVNTGTNFAPLRQMFYSMILASWYKMALKDALLTQLYGNQSKVKVGVNQPDPAANDAIFQQYLQAYKKGVFNYIKEDAGAAGQTTPRKYFSGGAAIWQRMPGPHVTHETDLAMVGVANTTVLADVTVRAERPNLLNRPLILVVDDNLQAKAFGLLIEMLKRKGYAVWLAADARNAINTLKDSPKPSLIVSDSSAVQDLLKETQGDGILKDVPLVLRTRREMAGLDREKNFRGSFNKDDDAKLMNTISRILNKRSLMVTPMSIGGRDVIAWIGRKEIPGEIQHAVLGSGFTIETFKGKDGDSQRFNSIVGKLAGVVATYDEGGLDFYKHMERAAIKVPLFLRTQRSEVPKVLEYAMSRQDKGRGLQIIKIGKGSTGDLIKKMDHTLSSWVFNNGAPISTDAAMMAEARMEARFGKVIDEAKKGTFRTNIRGVKTRTLILGARNLVRLIQEASGIAQREGRKFVPVIYLEGEGFTQLRQAFNDAGIKDVLQGPKDLETEEWKKISGAVDALPFIISFVPEQKSPDAVRSHLSAWNSFMASQRGDGKVGLVTILDTAEMRQALAEELVRSIKGSDKAMITAVDALNAAYARGETDEFVKPVVRLDGQGKPMGRIQEGDAVFTFNFRRDRTNQITAALAGAGIAGTVKPLDLHLTQVKMMMDENQAEGELVVFPPKFILNTLGQVLAKAGKKQFRIAETEKYNHVTRFFNSGFSFTPEPGEDRRIVPSPKVATYDLQPEMSAQGVTDTLIEAIDQDKHDQYTVNYANPDMIGHTGNLEAGIKAMAQIDKNLGELLAVARRKDLNVIIIADHGNIDQMVDHKTGEPHTKHTLNPVPFIFIPSSKAKQTGNSRLLSAVGIRPAGLSDVAPSILKTMGIDQPVEMTGQNLIEGYEFPGKQKTLLVILDGTGINPDRKDPSDAWRIASERGLMPNLDRVLHENLNTQIQASAEAVGLPEGQMGNSEVGHITIGAGRIVEDQPLPRVNQAIADGSFFKNEALLQAMHHVKEAGKAFHLVGLVSDGGVHSSMEHIYATLQMAKEQGLDKVYIHAILDGRDTDQKSAEKYLKALLAKIDKIGVGEIVDIAGRFYPMDRDNKWDRTAVGYDLYVHGTADHQWQEAKDAAMTVDQQAGLLSRINPMETPSWKRLKELAADKQRYGLRGLFAKDPQRADQLNVVLNGHIDVDFSKNLVDEETLEALIDLARDVSLGDAIDKMFSGAKINETENRAVLHVALRNVKRDAATGKLVAANGPILVDGNDVMPHVIAVLEQMEAFVYKVQSGEWRGASGKLIKNIINVGIGGSDLGPKMAVEALRPYKDSDVDAYFLSNVDGTAAAELMKKLDPQETLVIIASKTFTTQETMQNAQTLKDWVLKAYDGDQEVIKKHFVAVSTAKEKVIQFGIDPQNMFEFWDWVGGRYSVWSAIGLSLATYIGFDNFLEFLEGGHEADEHFRTEDFRRNIPVLKALLNVWYGNFLGADSFAILPYDQYLSLFPAFAQQFFMESNGKSVDRNGKPVDYRTGLIAWGAAGTDGQHSFYQLIHQGTRLVPADFIGIMNTQSPLPGHHDKFFANFVAQTEALAFGATTEDARKSLESDPKYKGEDLDWHAAHQTFTGNKPTTSILIDKMTPTTLGNLVALYEHQIFVEGIIWNIFSFDQWGVQLGKLVADKKVLPFLNGTRSLDELPQSGLSFAAQRIVRRYVEAHAQPADSAMTARLTDDMDTIWLDRSTDPPQVWILKESFPIGEILRTIRELRSGGVSAVNAPKGRAYITSYYGDPSNSIRSQESLLRAIQHRFSIIREETGSVSWTIDLKYVKQYEDWLDRAIKNLSDKAQMSSINSGVDSERANQIAADSAMLAQIPEAHTRFIKLASERQSEKKYLKPVELMNALSFYENHYVWFKNLDGTIQESLLGLFAGVINPKQLGSLKSTSPKSEFLERLIAATSGQNSATGAKIDNIKDPALKNIAQNPEKVDVNIAWVPLEKLIQWRDDLIKAGYDRLNDAVLSKIIAKIGLLRGPDYQEPNQALERTTVPDSAMAAVKRVSVGPSTFPIDVVQRAIVDLIGRANQVDPPLEPHPVISSFRGMEHQALLEAAKQRFPDWGIDFDGKVVGWRINGKFIGEYKKWLDEEKGIFSNGASDKAALAGPGGIDLNRVNMQLNRTKEGEGVQMRFNPAMIEQIKRDGFDGLNFEIQSIVPVANLPLLLGLRADEEVKKV